MGGTGAGLRLSWPVLLVILLTAACDSLTALAPVSPSAIATEPVAALKLSVVEEGVYGVSLAQLQRAGLAVEALDPTTLALSESGDPVPYLIDDEQLIFYGRAPTGRYTGARTYVVQTGQPGLLIEDAPVPASMGSATDTVWQTRHLEENLVYAAEARRDENSDVWFWYQLRQQDAFTVDVDLPTVTAGPARLRLNAWGVTHNLQIDNDHDLDLLVNGQNAGTIAWDGQVYHTAEVELPAGVLQTGSNQIVLDNRPEGASFLDIVQLNWVALDYLAPATAVEGRLRFAADEAVTVALSGFGDDALVLDVQEPAAPRRLTDWTGADGGIHLPVQPGMVVEAVAGEGLREVDILSPLRDSTWQTADAGADLLIITTDELAPALEPLAEQRRAEGLAVAVVPVVEIYDAFGHGSPSPESIRDFVAYAHAAWQTPPRYLLLVGDATTDYLAHAAPLPQNHVPSLLVPVQYGGETVSDSRLVDVDGDGHPELAVGRWPVQTVAEVERLVGRTLAYESGAAAERIIFATDDSEARFSQLAGTLIGDAGLPAGQVQLMSGGQAEAVTAAVNEGAWLTTYIGHGSITRWGKENIFSNNSVSGLAGETPPVVLQFTCLTGLFAHPTEESLSEAMLRHEGGPVLLVGATSLTLSSYQAPFAEALLSGLQDEEYARIGDAFQAAKLTLDVEAEAGLQEISDTFALFGDPSAHIVRP